MADQLSSNVQEFSAAEYATFQGESAGVSRRSRGAVVLGTVSMVLMLAMAVVLLAQSQPQEGRVALEGSDMKEIDGLLSHIDKITHAARSGHRADSTAHQELQESDDEDSDAAPESVKHGISHISKAMEEIQQAEKGIDSSSADGEHEQEISEEKKRLIIKKMKALQAQIAHDFKHVTAFGNKAGYLPPVQAPHV